jgi:hypothetical protein
MLIQARVTYSASSHRQRSHSSCFSSRIVVDVMLAANTAAGNTAARAVAAVAAAVILKVLSTYLLFAWYSHARSTAYL